VHAWRGELYGERRERAYDCFLKVFKVQGGLGLGEKKKRRQELKEKDKTKKRNSVHVQ